MDDDDEVIEAVIPGMPQPVINVFATKEEWFQHDPILRDGQLGIEYDPSTLGTKVKAGWAGKRYSELPYVGNLGADAKPKLLGAEEDATIDTIPAPLEGGHILVSIGASSLVWNAPDSGVYAQQGIFRPRILRQTAGMPPGPPTELMDGQLAVNLNGHGSGDNRPALYMGGVDNLPVLLLSQQDLLINLRPRAYRAEGGSNVAQAVNNAAVPIELAESELLVVSWGPWVYLFGAPPGRWGGTSYSGPGGPGNAVEQQDFIYVSVNYQAATMTEIINASAPEKSINADSALLSALQQMLTNSGTVTRPENPVNSKTVLTTAEGRIDLSLLPPVMLGLTYKDVWTPDGTMEYPPTPAAMDMYAVAYLANPYQFSGGSLAGLSARNGDQMIYNGTKWDIIKYLDMQGAVRADGTVPMTGNLNMGSRNIDAANGIEVNNAAFTAAKANELPTAKGLILDAGTF